MHAVSFDLLIMMLVLAIAYFSVHFVSDLTLWPTTIQLPIEIILTAGQILFTDMFGGVAIPLMVRSMTAKRTRNFEDVHWSYGHLG